MHQYHPQNAPISVCCREAYIASLSKYVYNYPIAVMKKGWKDVDINAKSADYVYV